MGARAQPTPSKSRRWNNYDGPDITPRIIWISGIITALLSAAMLYWIQKHGLHIIDEISSPEKVKTVLAAQTPAQHDAHFWMTLLMDIPYPFAYGIFFAGLIMFTFKKWGRILALPAFICIPADTIENISQLFILRGDMGPLAVKAIATPIKLGTYIPAFIFAFVSLGIIIYRRFIRR